MAYQSDWSRKRSLAILMGCMVWAVASGVQAETEYWYYHGELVTPADSRAVLSPYRLPPRQVPQAFAKPKPGGWDWQKRKQAYLKMRSVSAPPPASVPARPPVWGPAPSSVRVIRVGGLSAAVRPETKRIARALPFWPDIPVRVRH